jgi:hypothetical protein
MSFYGRQAIQALVHGLVRAGATDATAPIVVLEGCGGSGRTTLLRRLGETQTGVVPHALLDPRLYAGDQALSRPVSAMLLAAALKLRLRFPRLLLAHIAIAQNQINLADGQTAMTEALSRYRNRDEVMQLLGGLAAAVAPMVVPGQAGRAVGELLGKLLVRSLRRSRLTLRLSFAGALGWFTRREEGFGPNAIESLIDLAFKARATADDLRREVDEVLVAAFLADLRTNARWMRRKGWGCELLIDNGDQPLAVDLLSMLERVRRRRAARQLDADPLVVVVASSGGLADQIGSVTCLRSPMRT